MSDTFGPFERRMREAGLSAVAIRSFERSYRALERRATGLIGEGDLDPVESLPAASNFGVPNGRTIGELLTQSVVIKLNGGLGTGMGLEKAKSLLPVRNGLTFLDLIVRQVVHLRDQLGGGRLPAFLLMNSFSTSDDTREFLARWPQVGGPEEWELMQNRVPKVLAADLSPLEWPANRDLEWCPPGHGDLYASLAGSGWLDRLLEDGIRYAFVSNSDNLGATLDPALLAWFAESGVPFLMEVTRRTPADRKGGHLAVRKKDGRLVLRESAQCPEADQDAFQDIERHRYFNTNNLWIRLDRLREALQANGGILPLPMIRNTKTADPRDKASPQVYQLETAMGAAIESFAGSQAVEVDRSRFAPVKTTADLLVIRSSACRLTADSRLELQPGRNGQPPVVDLDPDRYRFVDGLEELIAGGVPCLAKARSLRVRGPVRFAPGVEVSGDVEFRNEAEEPATVAAGRYPAGTYTL